MVSTEKPESRTISSSVYSMSKYSENQYSCIRLRSTATDLQDAAIQAAHNVRPARSADSSTWSSDPRQLDLPGPTIKFAGCRRPGGESVKWSLEGLHADGWAGQGVAEEADGRQDAGSGGRGRRNERARGGMLAARVLPFRR